MFCNKQLSIFRVTIHIDGRHPYLETHQHDTETKDVVLTVPAKNWNHAEKVAMQASWAVGGWRRWVKSIEIVRKEKA